MIGIDVNMKKKVRRALLNHRYRECHFECILGLFHRHLQVDGIETAQQTLLKSWRNTQSIQSVRASHVQS